MAEYIDREALKEHIGSYAGMFTDELGFVVSLEAVLNGIDFIFDTDAVEVIRCKDCKYWDEIKHGKGWCTGFAPSDVFTDYDYFCSNGERKENENRIYSQK